MRTTFFGATVQQQSMSTKVLVFRLIVRFMGRISIKVDLSLFNKKQPLYCSEQKSSWSTTATRKNDMGIITSLFNLIWLVQSMVYGLNVPLFADDTSLYIIVNISKSIHLKPSMYSWLMIHKSILATQVILYFQFDKKLTKGESCSSLNKDVTCFIVETQSPNA